MSSSTEEFARLELEPQPGRLGPLDPDWSSEHDELLRLQYGDELIDHVDYWLDELSVDQLGVVLVGDTYGKQSGERTTVVMRLKLTKWGSRLVEYDYFDTLNQCLIGPTRSVELYPATPLKEKDLPFNDLVRLSRLSNPELGAVREMSLQHYCALIAGLNRHLRDPSAPPPWRRSHRD
jgi:hypothetical protein